MRKSPLTPLARAEMINASNAGRAVLLDRYGRLDLVAIALDLGVQRCEHWSVNQLLFALNRRCNLLAATSKQTTMFDLVEPETPLFDE